MIQTIFKYTTKTLFRNKKQFLASVMVVSMCITLVIVATITNSSMKCSFKEYITAHYGTYVGMHEIMSTEMFQDALENDKCDGFLYRFGTISSPMSIYDGKLTVGAISDQVYHSTAINIIDGNMPIKSGEAVVEKSAGEKLLENFEIGETVTLPLNSFDDSSSAISVTVTVTGIIEDYSDFFGEFEGHGFWPSIILSEEDVYKYTESLAYAVYGQNSEKDLQNIEQESGVSVYWNPAISGESELVSITTSSSVILTIISVSAGVLFLIGMYAYMALGEKEMIERFQTLKLIGAGKKELLLFTLFRSILLYLHSLIPGVVFGSIVCFLFSKRIMNIFVPVYSLDYSIIHVTIGCISTFLIILVFNMGALLRIINSRPLQGETVIAVTRNRRIPFGNILNKWIVTSALNRKKTYIGIIVTICLSSLVVFIGTAFFHTINEEYSKEYYDDYKITVYDGGYISFFKIPQIPYYGITDKTKVEFSSSDEIDHISYIKQLNTVLVDNEQKHVLNDYFDTSVREESESCNGDYELVIEQFNLDESNEYYYTHIIETDERILTQLSGCEKILGNIDYANLKDGTHVAVVCQSLDECPYNIGDSVSLFQVLPKSAYEFSPNNCDFFNCVVTISAIVEIPDESSYLGRNFIRGHKLSFVWGEGSFEKKGLVLNNISLFINLKDVSEHNDTELMIQRLKNTYPNSSISSRVTSEIEKQALLESIMFSIFSLVLFLTLVCFVIYSGIVRAKYLAQRKLWGVMRTLGVQKEMVLYRHAFETVLVFVLGVLITTLFLIIMSQLPIRKDIPLFSLPLILFWVFGTLFSLIITTPIVFSLFNEEIIHQIDYID